MINIQITDYSVIMAFWLAFTRWVAVIFQLPIFDNLPIPGIVKILTTVLFTYAFFPGVEAEMLKDIAYMGVDNFWVLTLFNTVVGLVIGFFVKSIMSIFIASGSVITQQVGFAAVRYHDPTTSSQVGPFERLIQWTIVVMVVSSGALLPMFKGIYATFSSIHIYDFTTLAQSHVFYTELFKSIFLSALLLASPLIFTNMIIMALLGIIARTVPQMNIIMVSFVVNIGVGLLVFAATSEEFFQVGFRIYTEKLGQWFQFVI